MFLKSKAIFLTSALLVATVFPTAAHATSCQPTKQLASSHIAQLHVEVLNASTGQTLFAKNETSAERSASVM